MPVLLWNMEYGIWNGIWNMEELRIDFDQAGCGVWSLQGSSPKIPAQEILLARLSANRTVKVTGGKKKKG